MKAIIKSKKSYKQQHYPVVEIHARGLIPTAINWHKATNFRQIEKVYKYHRPIYDSWIKKGLIPDYAIEKVKQYEERLREL